MYKVKIRRVFRTGHYHASSNVTQLRNKLTFQYDIDSFNSKFTAAPPPFWIVAVKKLGWELVHFLLQNPKYVFQNFSPDLQIESTQNFRAAFPIIHKYSQLFWTLLNRNKIIFTKPTTLGLFDYLIRAILDSKFLQNWFIHVQPTCSRTWRGEGRVRLHVG